jgi:hypothetical protein
MSLQIFKSLICVLLRRINNIIGCQGGGMSKGTHEPLKVNFPPFLGELRPYM